MLRGFSRKLALALVMGLATQAALANKSNDTLVAAFDAQLPSLDRYHAPGREGFLLGLLAYDALIYRDPNTFEVKPLLATSWHQIDPLTWQFDLRHGVKFHDGMEMTAEDVAFTLRYAADPKNRVFNRMTGGWIKSVDVVDPYTVRIHAKAVTPLALEYLMQLPIMPEKYHEKVGDVGFGEHPVGTGPYKIVGRRGSDVIFERNDDYFSGGGKNKPYIKTFIYRNIPDVNTQVANLISGGIDWAYYIPNDQAQNLARIPTLNVTNAQTFRIGFLTLDAAGLSDPNSPLKDRRVRQAIAYAMNRTAMASMLIGPSSKVIDAACTPSQFGCTEDVTHYDYNVAKAKSLLAEAGYPKGFSIDIYAYRSRPVAEAIIGYLDAVGIRANLHWMQYSAVIAQRRSHKTPIVIDDFGSAGVNDVGGVLPFFFDNSPDDQSRDQALTDLIDKASTTADPAARKALDEKAIKLIASQAYWVPLFTMPINYVSSKNIEVPIPRDENVEFWRAKWH
ncbi:ABC transporter substrate-binding protein [Paraburkholderia sp.]|uniref:ABC transporter substrate-binding protein n=1 Tax=Paraburkholderia sp. TaxID=1926495 RepID=UPI0039E60065